MLKSFAFTIIAVLALTATVFIIAIPVVVYRDHTDLVLSNAELADRNKELERLSEKCVKCQERISSKGLPQVPPAVPETVHDVLAEVRITCLLVNPSKMPEDKPFVVPSEDSYLEGAIGKSYLQSRADSYKRAEEEGKATAIEDFRSPPNSDLIGRPVSALANYSLLHVVDTSVSGGIFSECTFVEVTLRINGADVFRRGEAVAIKMDPTGGLAFDMKLEGMNLPK